MITDPESVRTALVRMHACNGCVLFWNAERTLKFMLRNDPETPENDELAFELCLVVEEDDEAMRRMLELMADGTLLDPTTFAMHTWFFDDAESVDAKDVMAKLNAAHATRVCPCGEAVITDHAPVCLLCHLRASEAGTKKHFCAICHEESLAMHVHRRSCGHYYHQRCHDRWTAASGGGPCPVCKQA